MTSWPAYLQNYVLPLAQMNAVPVCARIVCAKPQCCQLAWHVFCSTCSYTLVYGIFIHQRVSCTETIVLPVYSFVNNTHAMFCGSLCAMVVRGWSKVDNVKKLYKDNSSASQIYRAICSPLFSISTLNLPDQAWHNDLHGRVDELKESV